MPSARPSPSAWSGVFDLLDEGRDEPRPARLPLAQPDLARRQNRHRPDRPDRFPGCADRPRPPMTSPRSPRMRASTSRPGTRRAIVAAYVAARRRRALSTRRLPARLRDHGRPAGHQDPRHLRAAEGTRRQAGLHQASAAAVGLSRAFAWPIPALAPVADATPGSACRREAGDELRGCRNAPSCWPRGSARACVRSPTPCPSRWSRSAARR
jgi:hypothetical protein